MVRQILRGRTSLTLTFFYFTSIEIQNIAARFACYQKKDATSDYEFLGSTSFSLSLHRKILIFRTYSAANNCRLKHNILGIISSIFKTKRRYWSCLDMLSEIDFVKSKLNDVGYQEMLYSNLLPFIIEIEGKKTMVLFIDRRHYEKVLLRFRNRTITMVSIESWSGSDWESMGNFKKKSLRLGETLPVQKISLSLKNE